MNTTSASLLLNLKETGSPAAWARFVRIYTPILYSWAARMGLQEADALDLVQEVFTTLLKKLPNFSYDAERGFREWLWIVTRNKFIEKARRKKLPVDASAHPDRLPDAPERSAEEIDFQNHLVVNLLPVMKQQFQSSTWKAFWETVMVGRPPAEVSTELGLSVDAIYKAKARVISRLHVELADLLAN